jgi:hypothetical protein
MECLEEANSLMEELLERLANGVDISIVMDRLSSIECGKPYLDLLRGGEPITNSVLATTHYAQYLRIKPTPELIDLIRRGLNEEDLVNYIEERRSDVGIAVDLLFTLVMERITNDTAWRRGLINRVNLLLHRST